MAEKFCEATGKRIYESKDAAQRMAHTAMRYRPRHLRVYKCDHTHGNAKPCYGWHLTSEKWR